MQILIHDERPDELEFLPDGKVYSVYKAHIGAGSTKLIDMVSGERYRVALTNDGYEEVDLDQHPGRKSVCLSTAGISGNVLRKWTQKWVALFQKSFETLKFWQTIASNDLRIWIDVAPPTGRVMGLAEPVPDGNARGAVSGQIRNICQPPR